MLKADPTLKGSKSPSIARVVVQSPRDGCDPFRVETFVSIQPVALPPAIEFVAFGDRSYLFTQLLATVSGASGVKSDSEA